MEPDIEAAELRFQAYLDRLLAALRERLAAGEFNLLEESRKLLANAPEHYSPEHREQLLAVMVISALVRLARAEVRDDGNSPQEKESHHE